MRFRLKRKYRLEGLHLVEIRLIRALRCQLFHGSPFDKSHIVLIGRDNTIGVSLGGFFDQLKKRRRLLLSVYDKSTIEYLMATVFGVDL